MDDDDTGQQMLSHHDALLRTQAEPIEQMVEQRLERKVREMIDQVVKQSPARPSPSFQH